MEKIVNRGLLYDCYGALLTEHQREIYEDAVYHDLTLSEIAETRGISRQGVSDLLTRCTKTMQSYEERLRLLEKNDALREAFREIGSLLQENNVPETVRKRFETVRTQMETRYGI